MHDFLIFFHFLSIYRLAIRYFCFAKSIYGFAIRYGALRQRFRYKSLLGCPVLSLPSKRLRRSPPVCGTRQFPCRERLRHLPTTAHSAPSLYLPLAALASLPTHARRHIVCVSTYRSPQANIENPAGIYIAGTLTVNPSMFHYTPPAVRRCPAGPPPSRCRPRKHRPMYPRCRHGLSAYGSSVLW